MRRQGQSKGPFIMCIDIGSSSVKAALYDDQARPVLNTKARQAHQLHAASDGTAEELVEHLVERVESAIDAVLEKAGDAASNIVGVAMATMASTVLGVDRDDLPITSIYTYADTRTWRQAEELRHQLDEATIYQRTGCPLHSAYLPARLCWLQQTCPETVQRVVRWTDVGTFLYSRWLGRTDIPTSYSVASWMGLLDRYRLQWDEGLLEYLGVPPGRLPPLADYAANNIFNPDSRVAVDYHAMPHAVFASPQVASVGLTEQEARNQKVPYVAASYDYYNTAYGSSIEDRDGFVNVLAHRETREILGCHIIGTDASILVQEAANAMRMRLATDAITQSIYVHPALPEVVQRAFGAMGE